jgi:diadenosine tetraphosphate (Ap4A) HIT family hydrolase
MKLDARLQADCVPIGHFALCTLLLMNDAHYPWFILVPDRENLSEIYQLGNEDQQQLMRESCMLSRAMARAFQPDKLNVAALGNVVAQLHVHHIARYRNDAAWPRPVWGVVPAQPYGDTARDSVIAQLKGTLPSGALTVDGAAEPQLRF